MTRLLFIDQYGAMGGGQRVLLSLLRAAIAMGATVSVLAPGSGALQAAIASQFAGSVTFITCEEPRLTHGRKSFSDVLALLAYGWRFRRHRQLLASQDVIYVNGLRHLPHLLVLTRGLKARLIWHVHISHSGAEKLLLRLAARARNTWRLVVNSRFVQENLDIAPERICLIENALDTSFADRPFADRFAGMADPIAAVLGTLRPEKGQDIAVKAVAMRPRIALHLIGPDGEGGQAWIAAMKHSAGPNVHFEGAVPDTAAAIDRLGVQVNIVPSRWDEPFGLVAIEGMACSCLTITSGRGGLAEIAQRTGALVAPDAESLGRALDDLSARSPADLASLAHDQYRQTLQHYAPERFQKDVVALLAEATSLGAASR